MMNRIWKILYACLFIGFCLIGTLSNAQASPLESGLGAALEQFADYDYGQSKKVLHDTRMSAFRGANKKRIRLKNEQLLLTFVQSDASVAARREACLWLADIDTDASKMVLERLAGQKDFADVAQMALDALKAQPSAAGKAPSHALAQFKAAVMASDKQADMLMKALLGSNEAKARLAFNLIAEGVARKETCAWLGSNIQKLSEPRQIIAMNLLLQLDAAENFSVVAKLSRKAEGAARLAAIRNLGTMGRKEDLTFLTDLWLGADEASAEAAQAALRTMPGAIMRDCLLKHLGSSDMEAQAKAIQMVVSRGDAFATDALSLIAGQDNNPNQKTAIRAVGNVAPPENFQRLLQTYGDAEGQANEEEFRKAVWELAQRQPDYDKAIKAMDRQKAKSSEKIQERLTAMAEKLKWVTDNLSPSDIHAPKPAQSEPVRDPGQDLVAKTLGTIPYSAQAILKRREQIRAKAPKGLTLVAYIDCGTQTEDSSGGNIVLRQLNGKGFHWPGPEAVASPTFRTITFDDKQVDFEISGLNSKKYYAVGFTWWDYDNNGRKQSVWIVPGKKGKAIRAIPATDLPDYRDAKKPPDSYLFPIDKKMISDASCTLSFRKDGNSNVVLNEIQIWESDRKIPKDKITLPSEVGKAGKQDKPETAVKIAAKSSSRNPNAKRVLLITGEDYPGHHWRETTPVLRSALEEDSRLAVDVLYDLKLLASTKLDAYEAVVIHFKNYDPEVPGRKGFDNLASFANDGGGVVLVHFACGAFQEFKDDFVKLSGRVWNPKLRGHDKFGQFIVNMTKTDHPITRGLKDFKTTDELYTCVEGSTPITLLATAVSKVDKKTYPMAFVLNYGKGRVFHSVLGHDPAALNNPPVAELYRRATAWAAGLSPDKPKQ